MQFVYIFIFLCLLLTLTKCDLPIHGTMGDVYGTWTLRQTVNVSDRPVTCGGGIPNKNEENLNENLKHYESYLTKLYGELEDLKIVLTIEKTKIINEWKPRDNWTFLAVRDPITDDIIGHWSMLYDEGFEIRLQGRRYFGIFKYERNHSGNCPHSLSDAASDEDKRCYITDPTRLQLGWFVDEKTNVVLKEKIFHWGCFYAEKEKDTDIFSYVIHNPSYYRLHIKDSNDAENSQREVNNKFSISNKRMSYEKIRFSEPSKDYGSTKTSLRDIYDRETENHYACKKANLDGMKIELNLPKAFTWGDPYNNENFKDDVDDQEECGSCYAIASAFSLQKRFEIFFLKLYKKNVKMPKLSYQSILSCSPFNQSCDGGYPYLVGRQIYEFGIATEDCMKYANDRNDDVKCKIDMGNFNKDENNNRNDINEKEKGSKDKFCDEIYYASDYNYIGGCYECTGEFDMMNEILLNGPIVVAINAIADLLHFYKANKDTIYNIISKENKYCDIVNKGFNGWQYTNHAVNIVGWGEQPDENGDIVKYWIIRNTWGNDWGYKGYLKFQRGINLAGIESQAVYIDPDFTRGHADTLLKKNT